MSSRAPQRALCQLSVFPASFDLDAARNVLVLPPGNKVAVILEDLCLLCLLEWDAAAERYSLHDLVRTFAAMRLEDAEAVQLRHAWHYRQPLTYADQLYRQGGQMVPMLYGLVKE